MSKIILPDNFTDLASSTRAYGDVVTQIFHTRWNWKRTYNGILTKSLKEGSFTKMARTNGHGLFVNPDHMSFIEVIPEDEKQIESDQKQTDLDIDNLSKEQMSKLINLLFEKIEKLPN